MGDDQAGEEGLLYREELNITKRLDFSVEESVNRRSNIRGEGCYAIKY